jgi:L-alanine-DL-glutamate epimerase-like enolase superfamily enzyme
VAFAGSRCRARIPFRFGVATLREAPLLLARIEIEVGGQVWTGHSGDLAVPKWFAKDPDTSLADDQRALLASAERAARAFTGQSGAAFPIWQRAYRRCVEGDLASGIALVDGFGVALVERAMIDACCRAEGMSFAEALRGDLLGFDPGELLPETRGLSPGALVADPPRTKVVVRHTVGGLDPLRSDEVPEELRGDDDHPVALEEDIRRYGLSAFKVKVGGHPEEDFQRLTRIARVVGEAGPNRPAFTLDGNEQYGNLAELGHLLDRLDGDPDGRLITAGLLYLEQPLPRDLTLDPATEDDVRALARTIPVVIDEADDRTAAFRRALEIGYRGVSVKNCKGVFRALANRALCVVRDDGSFQTSEDLTNLPVLPLQQDLTTLSVLGLSHSERNGHHYFAGLGVVPEAEAESALAAHPDLYERRGQGIVLRIRKGELSLGSLHGPGYGYAAAIAWDERSSLDRLLQERTA